MHCPFFQREKEGKKTSFDDSMSVGRSVDSLSCFPPFWLLLSLCLATGGEKDEWRVSRESQHARVCDNPYSRQRAAVFIKKEEEFFFSSCVVD